MAEWISVKERLPETEQEVRLLCETRPNHYQYQCQGFYIPEKSVDKDGGVFNWDYEACDYDEVTDTYWAHEGWWERIHNWDDYGAVAISDFVTHWMPLPQPPEEKPAHD